MQRLSEAMRQHAIVAILGPRQCGKTTLARTWAAARQQQSPKTKVTFFDLENPLDLARLDEPMLALEPLRGLVVIDEIQRRPQLFPVLRVLADRSLVQLATGRRSRPPARFLILGSASRQLIAQSSESLAGRIRYLELTPFTQAEVPDAQRLWLRGGFPGSYLARSLEQSQQWRAAYIRTFLEQDVPQLGLGVPAAMLRRFWMMLAHLHGQRLNSSDLGRSLGISDHTVRRYLDLLTGTFMVRELPPWIENIGKRQVKASKIYLRDSGLFHSLLGAETLTALRSHPKLGASWEGFALEEVIRSSGAEPEELYFWSVHQQAELDLLVLRGGKRLGFEFKYADAPRLTRSMHTAMEALALDRLTVVFPGDERFALADKVEAVGLGALTRP